MVLLLSVVLDELEKWTQLLPNLMSVRVKFHSQGVLNSPYHNNMSGSKAGGSFVSMTTPLRHFSICSVRGYSPLHDLHLKQCNRTMDKLLQVTEETLLMIVSISNLININILNKLF